MSPLPCQASLNQIPCGGNQQAPQFDAKNERAEVILTLVCSFQKEWNIYIYIYIVYSYIWGEWREK